MESNDSPEIPDRELTSDIPNLLFNFRLLMQRQILQPNFHQNANKLIRKKYITVSKMYLLGWLRGRHQHIPSSTPGLCSASQD